MAKFKVPRVDPSGAAVGGSAWHDDQAEKDMPALRGFLGDTVGEGGGPRQTGTLLVFAEAGWLKACVTDRETGFRCFLSDRTWEGLLGAVEDLLVTGKGDWRPPRDPGGRKR